MRDGKLGSGIPLHRICICHGTSSPNRLTPKLRSSGAQDALEITASRWWITPCHRFFTMPRVIHQKLFNHKVTVICWKTFLIRKKQCAKNTNRQSGDLTNRDGMDTRKNSGEFPRKEQLQAMFFYSWRDFPGQIYITENPMGKFHHVKMGWVKVNWSPSYHSIWIRGHWVYLNPELNMVWWGLKVVLVVHLVVRHKWRHITRFSIVFVLTNISDNYIEDSSLRYSWLVRLGKII